MKAWIMSDLHVTHADFKANPFNIPAADVCLCAGDVSGDAETSVMFLKEKIAPSMPVIAVLGNHDNYGRSIDEAIRVARSCAANSGVRILENETVEIGDVRIIGATLWTDFEIPFVVNGEVHPVNERRMFAVNYCRHYMLDFHEISRSNPFSNGMPGLITSRELIARHQESRAYIATELSKPWSGKTVVLTHHAPLGRSLLERFKDHPSNAAFASDLSKIIHRGKPTFWLHGHIHAFFDYVERQTRVISNPRGYRHEREANGFKPGFVIDL